MPFFEPEINDVIKNETGKWNYNNFQFLNKDFPHFRFVDLFNGIEEYVKKKNRLKKIETSQNEFLPQLLHSTKQHYVNRKLVPSKNIPFQVSEEEEKLHPIDIMWIFSSTVKNPVSDMIIRLQLNEYNFKSTLEIAHPKIEYARQVSEELLEWINRNSIYLGKTLTVSYESEKRDEYGDIDRPEKLSVSFLRYNSVSDEQLIIDDEILSVINRNIINLFEKRELHKEFGVPVRRGVLFHGPPGTGKSFTCRYIFGKTKNVTKVIATGLSLNNINSIFMIARLFQPSLIILEDVDLVFSAREINHFGTLLGELFDHLDGLRTNEDIGVILTTNAIERVEEAIKDRPGRISQCIYFPPPNEKLRRLYMNQYLKDFNLNQVDMNKVIDISKGATQAFLKEWVIRTIQFALERTTDIAKPLILQNEDFEQSMHEMRKFGKGSTARILGFGQEI